MEAEKKPTAAGGLEAMLKVAFQSKFASLRCVCARSRPSGRVCFLTCVNARRTECDSSDSEEEFVSPKHAVAHMSKPLSASVSSAPRRGSVKKGGAGLTTAAIQMAGCKVPVDEDNVLSKSAPPPTRPTGLAAMLADIKQFKKDELKVVDAPAAPKAEAPRIAAPTPPKTGAASFMADLRTVSLRKTGRSTCVCVRVTTHDVPSRACVCFRRKCAPAWFWQLGGQACMPPLACPSIFQC